MATKTNDDDDAFFNLAISVLSEAGDDYRTKKVLSREVLLRLDSVFGSSVLSGALELLDAEEEEGGGGARRFAVGEGGSVASPTVVVVRAERTGRILWQVRGSRGILYTLLPNANYCRCQSWHYKTWRKNELVTCKHRLAARLALAMGKCGEEKTVSEDMFVARMIDAVVDSDF